MVAESSAAAAGAQWVAAESSAAAEAQCVAAGSSTAVESSTAAEGAQWAAVESSVAAGWSAPEYRLGSFEKSEREGEEFLLVLGRSILSSTLARHQGARLGTWGGEGRGEGVGSAPTPPHKPRCLIVKENTF